MTADEPHLSVADARRMIRGAGLRCTTCRIAVLQTLAESDAPLSHGDAADLLTPAGFDKSTIYRCLVELAEAGVVSRLELGDRVWRFELRPGHQEEGTEHPHFMCVDCGKVACLTDFSVRIAPSKGKRRAALGEITEVLLKGHCAACR